MFEAVIHETDVIAYLDEEETLSNNKEDVIHVIPANCKRMRAKLLQFCENRRPAYWGTWSKKSKSVNPRRPFGKDVCLTSQTFVHSLTVHFKAGSL